MSEGEAAHLGWVMAHPARARQRVRAARVFRLERILSSLVRECLRITNGLLIGITLNLELMTFSKKNF